MRTGLGDPAALNNSRCSATFLCSPRLIELSEENPSAPHVLENGCLCDAVKMSFSSTPTPLKQESGMPESQRNS